MKRLLLACLAAVLGLAPLACRRKQAPPESALRTAMRSLHSTPPCDTQIPLEWPASWPVPTGGKDGREFRVFFYPLFRGPGGQPEVFAPLGSAVFNGESGAVEACGRGRDAPTFVAARRWPESTDSLTLEEFELLAAKLLVSTEDVSRLFANQRTPSADEARRIKEYWALFNKLAEPSLRSYYEELNPFFFHWISGHAAPPGTPGVRS
ncbi:MAG: hypothetical protein WC943_17100 [Elusimicrobiota bacterium]|jgi:hypothetical protein